MIKKICFKCGETKPLSEFYTHKQMADGHLNKCKTCTKKGAKKRYNDPEAKKRIIKYERERFQRPERKKKALEYQKKRRQIHKGKDRARQKINNAIRDGRLIKLPCKECGNPAEAHHPDYRSPLKVIWLCRKHHLEKHNKTTWKKYTKQLI